MHKVGKICTAIVLTAVPVAIILGLVYATKVAACQRAADVLAAVNVCQDARAMCWSSPADLVELRRSLRQIEECKEWEL